MKRYLALIIVIFMIIPTFSATSYKGTDVPDIPLSAEFSFAPGDDLSFAGFYLNEQSSAVIGDSGIALDLINGIYGLKSLEVRWDLIGSQKVNLYLQAEKAMENNGESLDWDVFWGNDSVGSEYVFEYKEKLLASNGTQMRYTDKKAITIQTDSVIGKANGKYSGNLKLIIKSGE